MPGNPEEIFRKFWKAKAAHWVEETKKSNMDPVSKTRLEALIDLSFLKAYVNENEKLSTRIHIFIDEIDEEFGVSVAEESEDSEKEDEARIYKMIKDDIRELLVDPSSN